MEREREDRKLVRLGGESVDLSRTAFRIVQARDDAEMKEGWRGEESEDSGEDGFQTGEGKLEGRETGDREEEEKILDGEREDGNEEVEETDHDHLVVGEEGEPALFEEDETDDMFRSSNLIIIPFPRERNCSNPGVNGDAAVQEDREEAQSDNSSRIEEELEESENKDHPAEENSDKNEQVQLRICFPPLYQANCISLLRQATSLDSLWMLDVNLNPGADLSTIANLPS